MVSSSGQSLIPLFQRAGLSTISEFTVAVIYVLGAVGGGRAVNEHNLDDISAILDVSVYDYLPLDVSWGSGAGKFYVHHVDRAGYADVRARFEASRTTRSLRR
jgi:hypothetical protein